MANDNYRKGAAVENRLVNELREFGFYAERVAGSGTREGATADVVAHDGRRFLVFECKHIQSGLGPRDVSKDSKQLEEIRGVIRSPPTLHVKEGEVHNEVYFAVQFSGSSTIYLAPYSVVRIDPEKKDGYMRLWELV